MNWFFGTKEEIKEKDNKIEKLIQRIESSSLVEDKKNSIFELAEISSNEDFIQKFTEENCKVIMKFLKSDDIDIEILRQILFLILNLKTVK
jgi:hypothetical protein